MKLRDILSILAICASAAVSAQTNGFGEGCRIDYYNAQGERIHSEIPGSGLVSGPLYGDDNRLKLGPQILDFTPDGNGGYWVTYDDRDVAEVRFVAFGQEDYPLTVKCSSDVKDYGFVPLDDDSAALPSDLATVAPGTKVRMYIDLPDGWFPHIEARYLLTREGCMVDPIPDYAPWMQTFRDPYTFGAHSSWYNFFYHTVPDMAACQLDTPASDPEVPDRYWVDFTMPNEPLHLDLSAFPASGYVVTNTFSRAESMALNSFLYNITPGQPLQQVETGLLYYLAEMPGSDCLVSFMHDFAKSWDMFYNQDEGVLSSGEYVWNATMWSYAYALINQCNMAIDLLDKAEQTANSMLPLDDLKNRWNYYKAQALTLRAHAYLRLLQVYAPRWEDSHGGSALTVPLRTSIHDTKDKEPATMQQVLERCYTDLEAAIDLFSKTDYKRQYLYTYEPDLNVAYGTFARIAALRHDWQKVKDMAHEARQGKRIATSEEIFNGYTDYNKDEWIWSHGTHYMFDHRYANWCAWHCCNTYGAIEGGYTNTISRDLYNQIPETDERRDWWLTVDKLDVNPDIPYRPDGVNPATLQFISPILKEKSAAWLDGHKSKHNLPGANAYSGEKSVLRDGAQVKFWAGGLTGGDALAQVPYMRATEMYLYEAEACAELGLDAEAQALLMEINQPRNPQYSCALTGEALIDEVRLYRRIELWGEGFCWFDLKRWNLPMNRTPWEEGDVNSGNTTADLAVKVPVSQNNGWRHGIPVVERKVNKLLTEPVPGEKVTPPASAPAPADMPRLMPVIPQE